MFFGTGGGDRSVGRSFSDERQHQAPSIKVPHIRRFGRNHWIKERLQLVQVLWSNPSVSQLLIGSHAAIILLADSLSLPWFTGASFAVPSGDQRREHSVSKWDVLMQCTSSSLERICTYLFKLHRWEQPGLLITFVPVEVTKPQTEHDSAEGKYDSAYVLS